MSNKLICWCHYSIALGPFIFHKAFVLRRQRSTIWFRISRFSKSCVSWRRL